MYKIFYDNNGNISQYTKVMLHDVEGFTSAIVPESYTHIFDSVSNGDFSLNKYKVDINNKEFDLIDQHPAKPVEDYFSNKLVEIRYASIDPTLSIKIKSINSRPHIVVNSKHKQERKFDILLTRKNNVNFLYQTFSCETNKTNTFLIDQLDYRHVFDNNFSLYYKKIFDTAGYVIE